MTEEQRSREPLAAGPRWAAVAVLAGAGLLGIGRAWLSPVPTRLHPNPPPAIGPVPTASGSPEGPVHGASGPPGASTREPTSIARRINLNTATAAELDLLPGIGPALAARIVEDRSVAGPFASLDDLDRVPGIGPKTIAKLVPYAAVE